MDSYIAIGSDKQPRDSVISGLEVDEYHTMYTSPDAISGVSQYVNEREVILLRDSKDIETYSINNEKK